ncbi:MAG: cysteine synthase A, partial [Gammaproteobacteria bacterium]|nr:cysteine synthase A [Gammaproteobacteria bacterium]
ARDAALGLGRNEGSCVGVSAGATLAAGLEVAQSAEAGSVLLVMLPDTGERYLSTFMFEGINEGSDDDWLDSL